MTRLYYQPTLHYAFWLGVGFFFVSVSAFPQQNKPDSQQTAWIHDDLRYAQFPGGHKVLAEFLRQHVHYPVAAAQAGISGRVFTSFVIDTAGYISDITILKSLGYGCDEEAVRLVKAMPRWIPSTQLGKPIPVKYNLPVSFTRQ